MTGALLFVPADPAVAVTTLSLGLLLVLPSLLLSAMANRAVLISFDRAVVCDAALYASLAAWRSSSSDESMTICARFETAATAGAAALRGRALALMEVMKLEAPSC